MTPSVRQAQAQEMMKARPGNVGMSAIQWPLAHGPPGGIDTAGTRSRKHTKAVRMSHPAVLTSVWGDLYHYSHSWCGQRTMLTLALWPTHWADAGVAANVLGWRSHCGPDERSGHGYPGRRWLPTPTSPYTTCGPFVAWPPLPPFSFLCPPRLCLFFPPLAWAWTFDTTHISQRVLLSAFSC